MNSRYEIEEELVNMKRDPTEIIQSEEEAEKDQRKIKSHKRPMGQYQAHQHMCDRSPLKGRISIKLEKGGGREKWAEKKWVK